VNNLRILSYVLVLGAFGATGCSNPIMTAHQSHGGTVVREASCIDRSDSMTRAWIQWSLSLWAREIRSSVGESTSPIIFNTGFIGPNSYTDGFSLVRPVRVDPLPEKPSDPYATEALRSWAEQTSAEHVRVNRQATHIARMRPARQFGTDIKGCVLRARELGASKILLATDLKPFGVRQRAKLDVRGMDMAIVYFCASNDALACEDRSHHWEELLLNAGATSVKLIDPQSEPDRVF
jgi:hypothetical protein